MKTILHQYAQRLVTLVNLGPVKLTNVNDHTYPFCFIDDIFSFCPTYGDLNVVEFVSCGVKPFKFSIM